MAEEMELEVVFVVGQRMRGKMKYRNVRYFKLKRMTFAEYQHARQILMADLPPVVDKFLNGGYHVEYKGVRVFANEGPDADHG